MIIISKFLDAFKEPLSREFGWDRGTPIDRYYIDDFLNKYKDKITGKVLEIGDDRYTKKFGHDIRLSDVLHKTGEDATTTIIGDLCEKNYELRKNYYDCIIITQTLGIIYDFKEAVKTLNRILKYEGIVLVSLPGIAQISYHDAKRYDGDYWRFTSFSAEKLFHQYFNKVEVVPYGNLMTSVGFLYGAVVEDLTKEQIDYRDVEYELTVCVMAQKKY